MKAASRPYSSSVFFVVVESIYLDIESYFLILIFFIVGEAYATELIGIALPLGGLGLTTFMVVLTILESFVVPSWLFEVSIFYLGITSFALDDGL